MAKNDKDFNLVGLPIFRFAKLFLIALIFPIVCVSLLATLLPKRHAAFTVSPYKQNKSFVEQALTHKKSTSSRAMQAHALPDISDIKLALVSGSYSDLQILRPEYLGSDALTEASVVPAVKALLLEHLLAGMSLENWESWQDSIRKFDNQKSKARSLVDNMLSINFQLGRYLETAALLFSELYSKTSNGRLFSAEESLYNLLLQSNELFGNRTPAAISSRIYVDTLITDDATFSQALENLRAKLIVSFCLKRPRELDTHFLLLSSLKPKFFTEDVVKIYLNVLGQVSSKVTPRFREELKQHYLYPERARELSEINPDLKRAIFELYESNITAHLKSGDIGKAKSGFLQLSSINDNERELTSLQKQIDELIKEQKAQDSTQMVLNQPEARLATELKTEGSQEVTDSNQGLKLFSEKASAHAESNNLEIYAFFAALLFFVSILFKGLRDVILKLIGWLGNLIVGIFKRLTSRQSKEQELVDELVDELDASIKAGKTVPMTNLPRNNRRKDRKVVNL